MPTTNRKFPENKVIAVDVDGTLLRRGRVNDSVVAWCVRKKAEGYSLMLWSARGEAHARQAAGLFGLTELFDHIISKPGALLDDKGWAWINFTRVIRSLED